MESEILKQIEVLEREAQAVPTSSNGRKVYTAGFVRRAVNLFKRADMTQQDFAKYIGVQPVTFNGWCGREGVSKRHKKSRGVKMSVRETVVRVKEITLKLAEHQAAIVALDTELTDLLR